jgi:hypothetical protein
MPTATLLTVAVSKLLTATLSIQRGDLTENSYAEVEKGKTDPDNSLRFTV